MPPRPFSLVRSAALAALLAAGLAPPAMAESPAQVRPLEAKFGIRVVALGQAVYDRDRAGLITCEPASDAALLAYMPILAAELDLYAPDVVRASGLQRIVLCRDVKNDGIHVGGLADYEDDTIFVDVEPRVPQTAFFTAKGIHHEFLHMLDRKSHGGTFADDAWMALNPPGHKYGGGGITRMGDPLQGMIDPALVGFLSRYGTASLAEDKAELFAYLICRPKYVADRAWNDGYLRRKVEHLKADVQRLAPSMNSGFWDRIELLRGER